ENNDYLSQDWFQIPYMLKKAWWSEPYYDEGGGKQMMITYSVPIIDERGEVYAIITADVSLKALTKYAEEIKPYKESYVILISANASFISHPDPKAILNETIFSDIMGHLNNDPELMELGKQMVDGKSGTSEFTDADGVRCFASFGPVMNGWSMAIVCSYNSVLAQMQTMGIILILILIVGLAVLVFLCRRIIRRLTQPLSQFSESAREIAKGNFNAKLPIIHSKDEMLQLHDSFEYMQHSLTTYISELKTVTSAKQRIESELSIARTIQLGMVPKDFSERVYAILNPAREVGGDLYDFVEQDGYLYFAIGDVSGKGIPAALYMAVTRSTFRSLIGLGLSMKEVAEGMNSTVCDGNDTEMFVTFFIGKLNLSTGLLEYCNGGHNSIIIAHPNGTAEYLHAKANLAGGVYKEFTYQSEEVQIEPGAYLVLYTDGVSEAEKENKDQYGDERLLNFVAKAEKNGVKEMAENLLTDVHAFTDGAEQNDDITIMIVSL
ncbi:MAG: SpoIIE family protein phosphatase, partial [Prevotellaceae bacterium]|nr:SpoIIE family protein phosphatase [Prevotellaceae bacterium]